MLVSGGGGGARRTSGDGLIYPSAFPARAGDLDTSKINGSATDLRSMGQSVNDKMGDIDTAWSGLQAHYEAPEQERVYEVMDPAVESASDVKSTLDKAAGYLDTYASTLESIKPRLETFEERAWDFRFEVQAGVKVEKSPTAGGYRAMGVPSVGGTTEIIPWNEDEDTVAKNEALLQEYGGLLEEVSTAAAQCANDINALIEGRCVAPVVAASAEAFTNPQQPMPWGSPVAEEKSCGESVGDGATTFATGTVQGLGQSILGYNPETGDFFDGGAYGQAWGGMGDLIGSTFAVTGAGWTQLGYAATGHDYDEMPEWTKSEWMEERADVMVGGWGSMVGYDHAAAEAGGSGWHKWKENPWEAGTEAVLSVGTVFIPGAGAAGAGAKVASTGGKLSKVSKGGRVVSEVADFAVPGGSWALKGGATVTSKLRDVASGLVPSSVTKFGAGGGSPHVNLIDAVDDLPSQVPGRHTPVSETMFGGDPASSVATGKSSGVSADASTSTVDAPDAGAGDRVREPVGVGAGTAERAAPEQSVTSDVSGQAPSTDRPGATDGPGEGGTVQRSDSSQESTGPVARDGSPAGEPHVRPDADAPGTAGPEAPASSAPGRAGGADSTSTVARDGAGAPESAAGGGSGSPHETVSGGGSAGSDGTGSGATGSEASGRQPETQFAHDQVHAQSADQALARLLDEHGMTRTEFEETLLQPAPLDPDQLTPQQEVLRDIRAEFGAPQEGEPMQKVLRPEDYEKYMSGEYGGSVQGSVTRLEDGVGMRNVRELYDGLALGYDRSPFTAGDDSMKVMRFRADTDAEISAYSSMGGSGKTDGWTDPYMGNGYTKSIDPVVPESTLPKGSQIEPGAEIWTVRKDGTEVLDAQFRDGRWVKVP